MDRLLQDLRYAFRQMAVRPVFALVAGLSLAVGIGANTAIFSVVNAVLLRPLPGIEHAERAVDIGRSHVQYGGHDSFAWPDFRDLREGVPALEEAAAYRFGPMSLSRGDAGEVVMGAFVTPSYFPALGVEAERGRLLSPEEETGPGQHPVAVLSHDFWVDRLGADPAVVGSTLRLNRQPYTVVGVADEAFRGHMIGVGLDVYVPIVQFPSMTQREERFEERGSVWFQVLGLRTPGTSLETLNAQLADLGSRLAEAHPETNEVRTFRAVELGPIPGGGRGPATAFLGVLMALVAVILLVTCANVAGMFLARALAREKEIAVRLALGSGRGRLVRQLLTESSVVFLLGGAAGVALAWWGVTALPLDRIPLPVELEFDLTPDARVLLFSSLATLGTAAVFGLLPALGATRLDLVPSLKDETGMGRARGRLLRAGFVTAQVGLSLVLLVGAGLFLRSLQQAGRMSSGFDPSGSYMTLVDLDVEGYGPEEGRLLQDEILERVRSVPAAGGAALAIDLPLDLSNNGRSVWPVDVPDARTRAEGWVGVEFNAVTEGYFEALSIPVLEGRAFLATDREGSEPVVVVSRAFREQVAGGASPVGRRIRVGAEDARPALIVGVVEDTHNTAVFDTPGPFVYTSLRQDYHGSFQVILDAPGGTAAAAPALRTAVLEADPTLALTPVVSVERWTSLGLLPHRFAAAVTTALGVLALFLSALGIYGVLASTVARRRREIGVRMALGADGRRVVWLLVRRMMALAAPGLAVGGVLAALLGRVLRSQGFLIGLDAADPSTLGGVAALLAAVVAVATWVPARRAAAVEPSRALRSE